MWSLTIWCVDVKSYKGEKQYETKAIIVIRLWKQASKSCVFLERSFLDGKKKEWEIEGNAGIL